MVNESASLSLALVYDCGGSIELVRRTSDKNTRESIVTKNIKSKETVPLLKYGRYSVATSRINMNTENTRERLLTRGRERE